MERKRLTCNSFVFYGSFYEAISVLPDENQAHIYDAIFKFAFEDIEVELSGVEFAVFSLIKPQLIANRTKYENGCKGGRPRKNSQEEAEEQVNENQTKTETKPKQNRSITEAKPNENKNENYRLVSKLKNKLLNAGVYTGVHDRLVDEVIEALVDATNYDEVHFDGKTYTGQSFEKFANHLRPEQIVYVVNAVLSQKYEIENREKYIQGVFARHFVFDE